jgi:hypothetical protein
LPTKALKLVNGARLDTTDITSARLKVDKTWGRLMWDALEINLALWGMIFCAAVEAAQYL